MDARHAAQRTFLKGPAAQAFGCRRCCGPSKAELTDNRVIHTVAPVVAPPAFAGLPRAGSCARSPHPSPASGAPGATASSALRR
jgi:hypothetical protein